MDIATYLAEIEKVFATGAATEHSYRPALEKLFRSIDDTSEVINEPKKSEGGMPDFLFQRDNVPFGWCEAKDLGKDIQKLKGYSVEQRKRYANAYPNLIYTNGVDFDFIRDGESAYFVSIASYMGDLGGLQAKPDEFDRLANLLRDFTERTPVTVKSADRLSKLMAAKAIIIKDEVALALKEDKDKEGDLYGQLTSFKENLLPNLTEGEFADLYAETITYGMFAARYNDPTLPTFSRAEALELIPATNPFLRALFNHIAGPNLEKRLRYVLDDLVALFLAADPHDLFTDFGKFTARNDPFVHFYEDFLGEYNPKKRKARGVWYTPEPVVDFIVRAVDDVLKSEFGIAEGLASTERIESGPHAGEHKVQILDPATGTGTFLAKVVQTVHAHVMKVAPAKWQSYVEEDLIPRLHGFELLMASYTMCHLKLDLMLRETGYKPKEDADRFSVWLTNSLEPADEDIGPLFFQALRREAQGASKVKNKTPIMCVLTNPPYTRTSSNKGPWITSLIEDYKINLDEGAVNSLSQDEIKFIRLFQYIVENNGKGIVGFVVNNSFLDGVTHRVMRERLLSVFDSIYILNLRGDTNKGEPSPEGVRDENVFDIRQGVAIALFVRTGRKKKGEIKYVDLFGRREFKYDTLFSGQLSLIDQKLAPKSPYFFFKNIRSEDAEYRSFFALGELFEQSASGVKFRKDALLIRRNFVPNDVKQMVQDIRELGASALEVKYGFNQTADWHLDEQRQNFNASDADEHLTKVCYRPFDFRFTYYPEDRISKIIPRGDSRKGLMRHHLAGSNLALLSGRQNKSAFLTHFFVTDTISEMKTAESSVQSSHFLLYLYPEDRGEQKDAFAPTERTINFDPKLFAAICEAGGIDPSDQAGPADDFRAATGDDRPSEVKVFDYIYGVLHSPDYRETFAEFLKIDFPRIPYPASPDIFKHVSEMGEQLRRLHLMEDAVIGDAANPFMGECEEDDERDVVASSYPKHDEGHVWINPHQYFENVPETAWSFHIGGYQPAQKWLKDRKGRKLQFADLMHYQKIIKILLETDRIMGEIKLPLDLEE